MTSFNKKCLTEFRNFFLLNIRFLGQSLSFCGKNDETTENSLVLQFINH